MLLLARARLLAAATAAAELAEHGEITIAADPASKIEDTWERQEAIRVLLSTHGHATFSSPGADPTHDRRVAGMESAGDVSAGDDLEQGFVIAEAPPAESLANVGVEID